MHEKFQWILRLCLVALSICQIRPTSADEPILKIGPDQRIAVIGNCTGERMNLFGNFETRLQLRHSQARPLFRNFAWPADAVSDRKRPGNYTTIDDPYLVFNPDTLLCFFGFNESFGGTSSDALAKFLADYRNLIVSESTRFKGLGKKPQFVLVSPIAFESTGIPIQPDGKLENERLEIYTSVIEKLAREDGHVFVDLFHPTKELFNEEVGAQYTINGVHLNLQGDEFIAEILDRKIFGDVPLPNSTKFERVREIVNDKSWLHLQDYRMLNGWYVYGGRRTWDTETFPGEFRKIRSMVARRDEYLWGLCSGREVPPQPDDNGTGDIFIPETMFGSRDDAFREMREPTTLVYPTPDESIAQMQLPEGFAVECFASESDFPELANPTQLSFDSRGRLWVSCMINYPQWLPGSSRPTDRLLIFEDTNHDGKADECKVFYDKLICPTGFEFYKDGVIVVDQPRVLFLRDTDGDDRADEVTHLLDGMGTDDTHHALGAFEYSNGGRLHMLEGIAMLTTIETPWGPRREEGASGSYVWDIETFKISHFRTPGQYNPWCLVFDKNGNGILGDGTNAQQHWTSLLSGGEVETRASVDPIFDNQGIRPAAGNELISSRHFPEAWQNRLIYACVINMHGMPAFQIKDDPSTAGLMGERTEDLLSSTDMFFRPVDPQIGPDGALWFGDWCNALIGHMQYSQRDPNRDHEHGRVYRMVHKDSALLQPVTQANKSVDELLPQLLEFEHRTRYRARREIVARDHAEVLDAISRIANKTEDLDWIRELVWIQESIHSVDRSLLERLFRSSDYHHRAAATHTLGNEWDYISSPEELLKLAVVDEHPRVRLEAVRAASLHPTKDTLQLSLAVAEKPLDKWISYTLDHALQAMRTIWETEDQTLLAGLSENGLAYFKDYKQSVGMAVDIRQPLKTLVNVDADQTSRQAALKEIVAAPVGDRANGERVYTRICAACHQHGVLGKKFGPNLTGLGDRLGKHEIISSIVWPNDSISKGYETIMVIDTDGNVVNGFVLDEDDKSITLGLAEAKTETILKEDIEERKEMRASSMPEGLTGTIAPKEFLDLLAFLSDDWVATNPNLDYALQLRDGFTEVSRQTHVKIPSNLDPVLNEEAVHLLSHEGVRKNAYAVHSPNEVTANPSFTIRFDQPIEMHRVVIYNRRDATLHDRAKGLTFWASEDGEQWTEVFKSEEAYPDWSFDAQGRVARFLKFGLDRPGILHLDRITIFGKLVEPEPKKPESK